MWPYGHQNRQNSNFWYKFAPKKKYRGSIEKLEYRCTTRNLPLCNGTIIVLKITWVTTTQIVTCSPLYRGEQVTIKVFNASGLHLLLTRETAWCFLSLNISLSHSKSLKVFWNDARTSRTRANSYIIPLSLSLYLVYRSEIFSIK